MDQGPVSGGAEIRVLPDPAGGPADAFGPVRSVQAAELDVPVEFIERSWKPEYLERLARAYWAYLERFSLGLLKVLYEEHSRTVTLLGRIPLLRFRSPEYVTPPGLGQVTWPIERGLLVATQRPRPGLSADHGAPPRARRSGRGSAAVLVSAEVANFYPRRSASAGSSRRIGAWIYNQTQLRIHVLVTHGFLRSLTSLDLPESRVGSLLEPASRRGGDASSRTRPARGRPDSGAQLGDRGRHRLVQRGPLDLEELHAGRVLDDCLGRQALDDGLATPASTGVTRPTQWELSVGRQDGHRDPAAARRRAPRRARPSCPP